MTQTSNVYGNYLFDLGRYVKELALSAKEQERSATESARQFSSGRLQGLYEVVSLMQQQAIAFDIPLEEIGLADVDPERDLI